MGTLVNDCDATFLDCIASESFELWGTEAKIYQFQEPESEIDPLWGEEITTVYREDENGDPGIDCPVFMKSPDRTAIMGEEGYRVQKITNLEVATIDLESRGLERLRVGDIIYAWGTYWDVTESSTSDGQISDSGRSTKIIFDIVRRTEGAPESLFRPGEDNG